MRIDRLRRLLRELASPGGFRRHPVLAVTLVLIVALIIFGLALRPV
ncbi:hypothetical protein [Halorhodospira sp. 9622]|nr:hypothetical protein [Halorhodospira sp. 9622]MCG5539036.1 hypothetical protein [Halorhodospira sp. 9622]